MALPQLLKYASGTDVKTRSQIALMLTGTMCVLVIIMAASMAAGWLFMGKTLPVGFSTILSILFGGLLAVVGGHSGAAVAEGANNSQGGSQDA